MNTIWKWTAAALIGAVTTAVGLAQGNAQGGKAPAPNKKKTEKEVVAALEKELANQTAADEFSGVVLLAKDGRPIFRKAYGMADLGLKVPNNPETKFNVGSINKLFTRIAIQQLDEEGKLSPADTIAKWIPDYPDQDVAAKVTIRHLLEMSSGLGDIFTPEFRGAAKDQFLKPRDFFPMFTGKPLLFEPGTDRRYSNGGYVVLGAIIEAASGQDYYEYVREHIFKPAGMKNTDSWELDLPVANRAVGYTRNSPRGPAPGGGRRNNLFNTAFKGSPAGGGYSTVDDLLRFDAALRTGILFKDGRKIAGIGAAGGTAGCNAILEQIGDHYTFIVLSNYDPPSAERLGELVRSWFGIVEDGPGKVKVNVGGPR